MKKVLFLFSFLTFLFSQQAEITNIQASQRTDGSQIVDITYDLLPDPVFEFFEISVLVSLDGGNNWTIAGYIQGDLGEIIEPGNGKTLTWNFGQQFGGTYSNQITIKIEGSSYALVDNNNNQDLPFEMVSVTAGEYTFGENDETRTIDYDYEIMKYEVTDMDYVLFMLDKINEETDCEDIGINGQSCDYIIPYLGNSCDDIYLGSVVSDLCPLTCGTCSYNDVTINNSDFTGYYPGDANYSSGNYSYINFNNSKISWNGEIFEVEEGNVNHPVTGVTWFGSWAFATHYGMEIPDQYEWEKAARGNTGYDYPWGDNISVYDANYYSNNTLPVDTFNGQNYIELSQSVNISTNYICPSEFECDDLPDNSYIFFTTFDQVIVYPNEISENGTNILDSLHFLFEAFNQNYINGLGTDFVCNAINANGFAEYYDGFGWFGGISFDLLENTPLIICSETLDLSSYLLNQENFINGNDYNYQLDTPTGTVQMNDSQSFYGAYSMAGNVWEIVKNDDDSYFIRGGAFDSSPSELQSWYQESYNGSSSAGNIGFRCMRIINQSQSRTVPKEKLKEYYLNKKNNTQKSNLRK